MRDYTTKPVDDPNGKFADDAHLTNSFSMELDDIKEEPRDKVSLTQRSSMDESSIAMKSGYTSRTLRPSTIASSSLVTGKSSVVDSSVSVSTTSQLPEYSVHPQPQQGILKQPAAAYHRV